MNTFQFATIFTNRRKQLQLTQEDIAKFIGVSRAAVSKWEKGLSYPDITILPKLAMYFDISIDTLLGYEPQLTKERITKIYGELAEQFANQPFEQVEAQLEKLVMEYYSCYPFLMKMSVLLLNYLPQSSNEEKTVNNILRICERVKNNTEELQLLQEATAIEATLHLIQQRPEKVIELLGDQPTIEFNNEALIGSALTLLQQTEQAKKVFQVNTFQKLFAIIGSMTEGLMLEIENEKYVDETVYRVQKLIEIFDAHKLSINTVLVFYIRAAIAYAMQGRQDKAMEMVEHYLRVCLQIKFPLTISGGDYFYLLQSWIDEQQSIIQQAPRAKESIKRDMLGSVEQHPLLAPLLEKEQLQMLYKNVQHYLKEV